MLALFAGSCAKAPKVAYKAPVLPERKVEVPQERKLTQIEQWEKLVQENKYASIYTKLVTVNEFFNEFEFVEDRFLWGRKDYWATLFETLKSSRGDCEDFTIAKYFTLRDLNIPEENMRITYVISLKTKEPHMVLALRVNPSEEPIVLDTVNNYLFPVSRRPDLIPVYSFNSEGYWIAKKENGWTGERLGDPSRLSLWQGVLHRMRRGETGFTDG